jgi:eukaryotic-like serine/threonine-protein kinase
MPGQWRQVMQARLRANWDALKRPGRYQSPPPRVQRVANVGPNGNRAAAVRQPVPAAARQAAAPASLRRAAASPPPPEAPSLPSGRVRIAELAGSMLSAAPLVALLAVPAAAILGIDPSANPQQVAYLYGMALLGTWMALVSSKVLEARKLDMTMQRLISLAAGLGLGAVGIALARSLQLGFGESHQFFGHPKNLEVAYFGGLYTLTAGWSPHVRRDRDARFRFGPILTTALVSAMLIPVWPYERSDGIAIAALIATAVQLVSPWSETASAYARYVRASEKQKRKVKIV